MSELMISPVGNACDIPISPGAAELGPAPGPTPAPIPSAAPVRAVSPAVSKLLNENDLNGEEITGTGKNGNLTKADVVAYLKANTSPAVPEPDPFALDDDPPVATAATKEQVRTALVLYQSTLRDSLVENGTPVEEAKTTAMETARGLLTKVGNANTLGGLEATLYGNVVLAATAATNALRA